MTVTIKHVAARAGVSPKTVSRVINGEPHVRPEVRDAVQRVVDELGFRPNAFARGLSSARSYLLLLLIGDTGSQYAIALQAGALGRCRRSGYHLVAEPFDLAAADWEAMLADTVRALRPDGVVLAPPLGQSADLLATLARLGVPAVCVSPGEAGPAGTVAFDEEQAAADMTGHLLALGHRDIAFVEGDPGHASSALRRTGFERAMRDAGLAVPPARVVPGDFSFRAGLAAGEALLTGPDRPSAVFASNDDMALGVAVAAMKHHVVVPDQLSVAGFDDAATARLAWPPITTIRQPTPELGEAAIDMLLDPTYRGSPANERWRRCLRFELVRRESTGDAPPPAP